MTRSQGSQLTAAPNEQGKRAGRLAAVALFVTLAMSVASAGDKPGDGRAVAINGVKLDAEQAQQLSIMLGAAVPPGRYWYDPLLGAWGHEGRGTAGWLAPGLPILANLPADASGRWGHGVRVNGRELHPDELGQLSRCTQVIPGRYWLRFDGWGGLEGQAASFNLRQLCSPDVASTRSRSGLFSYGGVVGDGDGFGFIDGEGRSAHGGW